ncbi:hypothetical protein A8990_11155 [Paenibacillus taihuensis]|uniref:Putative pyruvate, phosphate dikinase regulatory protein n=1 Tax=Paenibacillus taihuensis TaxID=1156355 RepID=A0A3D9S7N9_9BACL|nr:pyruvate, water dikinase regulatory protein [Paenibacillus taihuensis]REE86158.1 hypothetical protein A8990_11155 [Paenibacillus taihuensis]
MDNEGKRTQPIYICSDAVGETAETVVKAAMRQFASAGVKLIRFSHLKTEDEIVHIVTEAAATGGFIAYTLVQPELRETMKEESRIRGVRVVDVLGPVMQAFIDTLGGSPKRQPGLLHTLDDDYFRRIEAIEFAVKYDDGKDTKGLLLAEVVLIGVSRTSKTPLSIYLAHKGVRVANLPLVPEVKVPDELFAGGRLVVGLMMNPDKLASIRTERLKAMGLPFSAKYASAQRIRAELTYASELMRKLNCPIIDVSEKAIEETAGLIIGLLQDYEI